MAAALPNPCQAESMAFVQCRAMDTTGMCRSCDPITFDTIELTFSAGLRQKFMASQAYAQMNSPEFCGVAQDAICADYEEYACCCATEVDAWQSCLVENFSVSAGLPVPCTVSCAAEADAGDGCDPGGGSMLVVIIGVLCVLAIRGGAGGFFWWRKRKAAIENGDEKSFGSNSDDDENNFKDEKGGRSSKKADKKDDKKKKGGIFSRDKKEVPRGSDDDDDDDDDQDDRKNKKKNNGKTTFALDIDVAIAI